MKTGQAPLPAGGMSFYSVLHYLCRPPPFSHRNFNSFPFLSRISLALCRSTALSWWPIRAHAIRGSSLCIYGISASARCFLFAFRTERLTKSIFYCCRKAFHWYAYASLSQPMKVRHFGDCWSKCPSLKIMCWDRSYDKLIGGVIYLWWIRGALSLHSHDEAF
jgi:hypothetical protein